MDREVELRELVSAQAAAVPGVGPHTVTSQTRVALQRLRELAPGAVTALEGVQP